MAAMTWCGTPDSDSAASRAARFCSIKVRPARIRTGSTKRERYTRQFFWKLTGGGATNFLIWDRFWTSLKPFSKNVMGIFCCSDTRLRRSWSDDVSRLALEVLVLLGGTFVMDFESSLLAMSGGWVVDAQAPNRTVSARLEKNGRKFKIALR